MSMMPSVERHATLDILRGIAVLGILVMNIQLFAMPAAAYLNPAAYGDLTGANWLVWLVSRLAFDQKFMTAFSLLFGAGVLLFADRAEAAGDSARRLHYRRMGWLLVFGLVHAYGLWPGDILVTYALCGMLLFPLRLRTPRWLLAAGVVMLVVGSAIWVGLGWSMSYWPAEAVQQLEQQEWRPPPDRIAEEIAAYRGGWWTQMQARVPASLAMQTLLFAIWGFWRAGGLILIGMGLYRLGILTGRRPSGFYGAVAAVGIAVGVPLTAYGVARDVAAGWDVRTSFFLGMQWNYWGSLFLTPAWMALVVLACRRGAPAREPRVVVPPARLAPLAAVGRMAFTNYLLQTLVCTTVFYGHGLGWFGQVSRSGQALVVLGVWIVILVLSPLWLRRFAFGPVEWLWRSLTYGRRPPFRRLTATPPPAIAAPTA